MFQLVTDGHLCLSVAMGVRTGLFEAMSEMDQPKTATDIAKATNYKERYDLILCIGLKIMKCRGENTENIFITYIECIFL